MTELGAPPSLWVVIPAAGAGRRFGGAVPKQYLPLAGRLVIEHSLEVFLRHPATAGIVVAVAADDTFWQRLPVAGHPRVVTVTGGVERQHSVARALDAVPAEGDPWVAVHDAARPCLEAADVDALLAALDADICGCVLGVPASDTLKQTDTDGDIQQTLSRTGIWQAHTPQLFRRSLLQEALGQCEAAQIMVTDEAGAVERLGGRPRMVSGGAGNIKITRGQDLPLAAAILAAREAGTTSPDVNELDPAGSGSRST